MSQPQPPGPTDRDIALDQGECRTRPPLIVGGREITPLQFARGEYHIDNDGDLIHCGVCGRLMHRNQEAHPECKRSI